jgi:acetyl-CoA carboxylase biotin carboxyl carrier protein
MTNEEIRQLIQIVVESGVAELEVQRGENRVRIRRTFGGNSDMVVSASPTPTSQSDIATTSSSPATPVSQASAPIADNVVLVKSPIVGTFYDAPAPGAPPFVRIGDTVEPGQVLCIIESMKLMNEIEAEAAGTIVSKLMENGRPVEYGEALFALRPR